MVAIKEVSVFVCPTSGIGKATVIQLATLFKAPKIYLVGESKTNLINLKEKLQDINSRTAIETVVAETSLLEHVDTACQAILQKESKVDLLFMSTGYLSFERTFTTEGLDKLSSLRHYSRLRFIYNLFPALKKATSPRVVSVLGAGNEGKLFTEDLSLKDNWSLEKGTLHVNTMHTLALEELSKTNPEISFLHVYPGFVGKFTLQKHPN